MGLLVAWGPEFEFSWLCNIALYCKKTEILLKAGYLSSYTYQSGPAVSKEFSFLTQLSIEF